MTYNEIIIAITFKKKNMVLEFGRGNFYLVNLEEKRKKKLTKLLVAHRIRIEFENSASLVN